ncbi:MAG: hypothetical protein WC374_06000 [Phycisphaerae bacterium]|jgi:hypothetical protein
MIDDIKVYWMIPTFDRRLNGPFPLPQRHYILDWTKATKNEQAEIMEILDISNDLPHQRNPETWGGSETLSVGLAKIDERMLKFRHMFVDKSVDEQEGNRTCCKVFATVNLGREYFEDETGREISKREMMQIASGNKNLIPFDTENIMQLGPCHISAKETWTVEKANTIFNFMQVVRLIWSSSWAQKKSSITYHKNTENLLVKCDFPTVENMCAVLPLFRQFYAPSDKLMEKVCGIYKEHAGDAIKKMWVDLCLKSFKDGLQEKEHFIQLHESTVMQLFESFIYGTGLIHSPSNINHNNRRLLSKLIELHGREKIIMAVNSSFWVVFGFAADVFHVVKQDYEYWTEEEGCTKSDMFDICSLLKSNGTI